MSTEIYVIMAKWRSQDGWGRNISGSDVIDCVASEEEARARIKALEKRDKEDPNYFYYDATYSFKKLRKSF
ncbi:MAG: hypothetical protein ACYS30_22665 [Planctomycetota bacterium]|jgi:hypothetical protein